MSLYEWIGLIALLIGGYWALAKVIVSQFKGELRARFKAQDELRKAGQEEWTGRFERVEIEMRSFRDELYSLQKELPLAYVRREDAIRENTIINAKLDALHDKIDNLADRVLVRS